MPTIFDDYFTLSDAAITDATSLTELVALFASDAVVSQGDAEIHRGVGEVTAFSTGMISRNSSLLTGRLPDAYRQRSVPIIFSVPAAQLCERISGDPR
jgi:hypothetical protein